MYKSNSPKVILGRWVLRAATLETSLTGVVLPGGSVEIVVVASDALGGASRRGVLVECVDTVLSGEGLLNATMRNIASQQGNAEAVAQTVVAAAEFADESVAEMLIESVRENAFASDREGALVEQNVRLSASFLLLCIEQGETQQGREHRLAPRRLRLCERLFRRPPFLTCRCGRH